ncbi:MAG: matrixin family metalloprotease [Myxococcales bacterium]|nr:matrixin family metalloprotease [Myxococcales bacterium]
MTPVGRRFGGLAATLLLLSCVQGPGPYTHSRYDYASFRAWIGALPEPNYLPWVAHRERLAGGAGALVICRWPDSAFPLRYHVVPPVIPDARQNEFHPRDPLEYVASVHQAFTEWQDVIGRPVRFVPVDDPAAASVVVRIEAPLVEEGSAHLFEGVRVLGLGMLPGEEERCSVTGEGETPGVVEISYAPPEILLFVTDPQGLLTPRQVRRVAMHEIGHLLGASGQHSPLRGDLMFPIAEDSRVENLSEHDVNSFRALYRIPPGTVYARVGIPRATPMPEARRAPPRLGHARAHEQFPIELRFPVEWQVLRTPRGWIAVDGLFWDNDASIQVMALRGSFDSYLGPRGRALLMRGELVSSEQLEVDGRRSARIVSRTRNAVEEITLMEWDPGWVLVVIGETADENYEVYKPWFRFTVLSIDRPEDAPDRGTRADREGR